MKAYGMAGVMAYAALAVMPLAASASAPLIYEGTLTNGDGPPDPWPGLRFSVVDADGEAWWSTMVAPEGPLIEVGPDGRFVAYLEDSAENPWALAGFDQGRWLRVEVCPGAWPENPADDCGWVQLEQTQRLGTVPMAETISEAERARIRAEVMAEMWVVPDVPGGDVATLRVSQSGEPGTFGSVHEALASLSHKKIPHGMRAEIRIEPADEPYVSDRPIFIDREDGSRLHIIGEAPPDGSFLDVVLEFDNSAGIVVLEGARLGRLDGMTLLGDGLVDDLDIGGIVRTRAGSPRRKIGILARPGAVAQVGPDVRVTRFGADCLHAAAGIILANGVQLDGCLARGAVSEFGGFIDATRASFQGMQNGRVLAAHWNGGVFARSSTIQHADEPARGPSADAMGWTDVVGADWVLDDPDTDIPRFSVDDNSFLLHTLPGRVFGQDSSYAR